MTVENRLPYLTKEIDLRTAENAKLLTASLPLELLHRLEVTLQNFNDELSMWNHDLTEYAKALDEQIAHLDQLSKVWQSTLQSPELSQAAPEILKRVQSLIDSIGRTRQALESRRATALTLEGRVLESTAQVQTASSAVEQAEARAVKNLLVQDSPPIWGLEISNWREESRASFFWQASLSVLSAYIKARPTIFLLHAIIILILVVVVHWLRRGVHKWTEEEPSLRRAAPVFDLPVSTAIALSFVIIAPVYSLAPGLLRAILGAAVLIPTTLILRRLIDRTLFPILNALLVFYFVDQLRLTTAALPLFSSRFIFIAEMAGGTLFLLWLIRSKHLPTIAANTAKRFAGTIRGAVQFGLILFPATLLANVFGYVNLANLLGNGALRSAYVAAALYAILRIVEGLITIALEARPLALMHVVRLHRPMLQRRICGVAEFLAFLFWLSLTLSFFGLLTPLVTNTEAALRASLTMGSLNSVHLLSEPLNGVFRLDVVSTRLRAADHFGTPSAARRFAIAAPMLCEPPVTSATLPSGFSPWILS